MAMARMIVFSLMAGFVAAGFTFLAWCAIENLKATRERQAAEKASENAQETGEKG